VRVTHSTLHTVAINGTVTWTWVEAGEHNIGSLGNPTFLASEPQVENGSTYRVTFPAAGTYAYECGIHGSPMAGLVVVR
jgi:plastocyanin